MLSAFGLLLAAFVLGQSEALKAIRHVHKEKKPGAFVKGLKFKHRLRVCNAYPNVPALHVYQDKEKLTSEGPLPYKSCEEFRAPLQAGDRIEFKIDDASAGTFSVADLPNHDAVLLLMIHRHDTMSTAVSFESHVFANLLNAQVAIIDTYKGKAVAHPRIQDKDASGKMQRNEDLRFNSVVAVNPGIYKVALAGPGGDIEAESELVALNRESYVVVRMGAESQMGTSFPQELVVFPHSDPDRLHSGASALYSGAAVSTLLCVLVLSASSARL
eukprot:TRINITY_DN7602_c0_g3_i1.p1 TRINITY_DN7602_c0_g3~~TRINITY_DN7602_c0_g3_i1.p1  ORF type:complete len:272 (+),score=70.43 TRINITY_DN7602_c0_g3_i1:88-903(+)